MGWRARHDEQIVRRLTLRDAAFRSGRSPFRLISSAPGAESGIESGAL